MPVTPPIDAPAIVPDYWSFTTLTFNRSQEYPDHPEYWGGIFPNDLHVYDINGDGHLDILQVYTYIPAQDLPGIPIRVLLGDGQGNFTDGTASLFPGGAPLGDAATGSSVADFNGDGVLDIYIGMTWETPFDIERRDILLLSDGNGGVVDASNTLQDVNDYTHWTSAADIDGDGDIDLYVGNLGDLDTGPAEVTSHFLINDGTGNFVRSDTRLPATIENAYRSYTSCLLFDADNDGDPDLVLGMWPRWSVNGLDFQPSLLLFNDGTGNFVETAGSILPDPVFALNRATMLDMDATDLSGDGYADLIMLTADSDAGYGMQVLINNGDGTFRDETASRIPGFVSGTAPHDGDPLNHRYFHLTDFSGDGVLDLVLETGGSSRFYLNDGTGHFVAMPADFLYAGAAAGGFGFVPGDFNEDGRTDFFVRTIINFWEDPDNVTEFDWIALWTQPAGTTLSGDDAANAVLGTALAETLYGLGGDDVLSGGAGADSLSGGAGADTLIGGAGNDTMSGDGGDDLYVVAEAGDVVTELESAGTDTVRASASYILTGNVENLTLTGNAAVNATGNSLDNIIIGNGQDNVLNGGSGADTMQGGAGNDSFYVDNEGDQATEAANEGTDWVYSSVNLYIGANVENLTLTSTAISGGGNSGNNTIIGNAQNNVLNGDAGADTMLGGAGNDSFYVDNAGDLVSEGLNEGTDHVYSSMSFSLWSNVENLTLTGTATNGGGNAGNNIIIGNAQNNVLNGDVGADTMLGGAGNDIFYVDNAGDQVSEIADQGTDHVYSSMSFSLWSNVENLTLTGSATNGGGNAANNIIIGNAQNNVLNGDVGADTMLGGAGNDIFYVDNAGDQVSEIADQGTDHVYSSMSFSLWSNVENLTLTGTATNGGGNAANNIIIGNAQNNVLNGDVGADTMLGGAGNDIFYVDNAGDAASEIADQGTDHVYSSMSFSLWSNVENLTLTGSATNGGGNDLDNIIIGNAQNNVLNGDVGADTMLGGAGNDIFYVDNAGDQVSEIADQGTDHVYSSMSFSLWSNVENLTLTGSAITGGGNAANNIIIGNAQNNVINGDVGADTMLGGAGNDIFYVDNAGDQVSEIAGEGTDQVYSSVSFALWSNVENLTLTGASATNATGNAGGNSLAGNSAANVLAGGGGNDILLGGAGADSFLFDTSLNAAANADQIIDFSVTDDTILLDDDIFAGLSLGTLDASAFRTGAAATDADDRIIYDSATGNLYYDADGNGAAAATLFAQVSAGSALTNSDFLIVG